MSPTRSILALTAALFLTACGGGGGATRETPPAPPAPETPAPSPDRPRESPEQDGQDTNTPPRPVAPTTPVAPPNAPGGTNVRVSVQEETGFLSSWSRVSEDGGSGNQRGTRNASVRSKDRARASGVRDAAIGSEAWVADRLALQPGLRDVRAHGAWRRNLTGEGVRIVVRDDPVDPNAAEIQGRTSTEGAVLGYWSHSFLSGCSRYDDDCQEAEVESAEAARVWIADYLSKNPYPEDDDSVFVRVKGTDEYFEVPALFDGQRISEDSPRAPDRSHGTLVASVAAGKNLGVAPRATIVSQAVPFEYSDGRGQDSRVNGLARSGRLPRLCRWRSTRPGSGE